MNPCYIYITTNTNQPPIELLLFIFFFHFSYAMRYCFVKAPPYWDLWGGRFCAVDVHLIPCVIPSNFKYDALFQSKLTPVHGVSGLYICTKVYQGMSTMSDTVVDWSSIRGWSFPRGLSRCYEPILHNQKGKSIANKALIVHFFLLFFICHEILLPYSYPILRSLGWLFLHGRRSSHNRCHHVTNVIHYDFKCNTQIDLSFLWMIHGNGLYKQTKFA